MQKTENYLKRMAELFNEHPLVQELLDEIRKVAIKEDWSKEKWEQMKASLLSTVFYKIALEHEDVRNMLVSDVYEMLRAS